jgi:hypothetical protein
MLAIASRTRRLEFVGPPKDQSSTKILNDELDSIMTALKAAAPNLSNENAEQIAYGTVCEWIM